MQEFIEFIKNSKSAYHAVKEIEKARAKLSAEGKEIPAFMLEMWRAEHEDYIDKMAEIRYKIDILKK